MISVDLWMGMRLRSKTLLHRYESNSISSQHQQAAAAKCKSYFHILIKFNCSVRHEIKYVSPGNCKIAWMNADHRCSLLHIQFALEGEFCEEAGVSFENLSRQVSQHSFMNSLKSESFVMLCVRYYLTMFTRIFNRIIKMNNSNNILYTI